MCMRLPPTFAQRSARSPVKTLILFFRIFPEMWAITLKPFASRLGSPVRRSPTLQETAPTGSPPPLVFGIMPKANAVGAKFSTKEVGGGGSPRGGDPGGGMQFCTSKGTAWNARREHTSISVTVTSAVVVEPNKIPCLQSCPNVFFLNS